MYDTGYYATGYYATGYYMRGAAVSETVKQRAYVGSGPSVQVILRQREELNLDEDDLIDLTTLLLMSGIID